MCFSIVNSNQVLAPIGVVGRTCLKKILALGIGETTHRTCCTLIVLEKQYIFFIYPAENWYRKHENYTLL